jgi:hypothetical protein
MQLRQDERTPPPRAPSCFGGISDMPGDRISSTEEQCNNSKQPSQWSTDRFKRRLVRIRLPWNLAMRLDMKKKLVVFHINDLTFENLPCFVFNKTGYNRVALMKCI